MLLTEKHHVKITSKTNRYAVHRNALHDTHTVASVIHGSKSRQVKRRHHRAKHDSLACQQRHTTVITHSTWITNKYRHNERVQGTDSNQTRPRYQAHKHLNQVGKRSKVWKCMTQKYDTRMLWTSFSRNRLLDSWSSDWPIVFWHIKENRRRTWWIRNNLTIYCCLSCNLIV